EAQLMTAAEIPPVLGVDDLGPDTQPVAYEVSDSTAYVTLNRPDFRNAQNSVMTYSLDNAFIKAVEDDSVKVIVLRAAGERVCAGRWSTAREAVDLWMLIHVGPRDDLQARVDQLAGETSAMPAFGLPLTKKAVNASEDQMGLQTSLDTAFGWHMFAHSANA